MSQRARANKKNREKEKHTEHFRIQCMNACGVLFVGYMEKSGHPRSGHCAVCVGVCVSTTINKYVKHRRVNRWWHQRFTTSKLSPHPPSPLLFIVGKCLRVCVLLVCANRGEKHRAKAHCH